MYNIRGKTLSLDGGEEANKVIRNSRVEMHLS